MYKERFPKGARVRVAALAHLEAFRKDWAYHHKLQPEQLQFASCTATIKSVGFYHGGDVIYQLEQLPGTWHESCLEPME